MSLTSFERAAVLAAAGVSGACYPVVDVDGFMPPTLCGSNHYWTTPFGLVFVYCPDICDWKMKYHPPTLHVEVGRGWLLEHKVSQ